MLGDRVEERAALRLDGSRPAFYFDLACPLSYLAAERVERLLGEVDWVPVAGPPCSARAARQAVERAQALRLPLQWPDGFPEPVRDAMRAVAYAVEGGAGARFALAAFRLAFCGGYDLDDRKVLAELAAAVGIPPAACTAAARDEARDEALHAAARALERRGIRSLPAIRVEDRWFGGEAALTGAAGLLRDRRHPPVAHLAN